MSKLGIASRRGASLLLGLALLAPLTTKAQPAASNKSELARPRASLSQALHELETWVATQGGKLGVSIVDLESGAVRAEINAKLPLNPASNMKVVTAAVVLDRLGPAFTFTTGLYGQRQADRIDELVLRGSGDPSLNSEDLWSLANTLKQSGVSQVGVILVDQSAFDAQFIPPGFEQKPSEWAAFRAPVSAIAVNENAVTLHVLAQAPQNPARIWFDPPGVVSFQGQVMSQAKGSGQNVGWTLEAKDNRLRAILSGHLEADTTLQFSKRMDDPRFIPGLVLKRHLTDLGVVVKGDVRLGGEKILNRLALHQSAPLTVLLHELGKASNNFYAEMLLKALARESSKTLGSSATGCAALEKWLTQHNAWTADTVLRNGSGLYDANRVTAWSLTRTLAETFSNPRLSADYVAQLAIGGVDGTLAKRFRGYGDSQVVRAKTGTLNSVDSLSGLVLKPQGHGAVAFSLLVDGIAGRHAEARERMDAVVTAIAEENRKAAQP